MAEDRNGADGSADGAAKSETPAAAEGRGLGSVLYKVGLAGVGALILAQEEIEAAWRRAREKKGEGASDGPPPPAQTTTGDTAETKPDGSRVSAQIDGAIGRVLRSLSIPTRDEVDAVSARIDALLAKLDARDGRRK
jgi:hypothetical protein